MIATKDVVIAQALALSEAERLEVIQQLSESLGDAAATAADWDDEIDRRLDKIAAGEAKFVPWEQARREIIGETDAPHG